MTTRPAHRRLPLTRRDVLAGASNGFGLLALNAILAGESRATDHVPGRHPAARIVPRA